MADDLDRLRHSARHLLQRPLVLAEREPELFAAIRRQEQTLDRWFTQRLGYRLHVSSTTARLFKSTVVPHRRPLMTSASSPRALNRTECTLLALLLAAVAAGPRIISLRDLIDDVRTAATDAEVVLGTEPADRRALVVALRWMIVHGLAREVHERVDRYERDADADAVLEIDPDRVGLLPLPALGRARSAAELRDRTARRRENRRRWMRARLVEDPVLYAAELDEEEWLELRRRVGEEAPLLEEMFGLELETRAEGVAAIDASGRLSSPPFPTTGTIGHAALLMLDALVAADAPLSHDSALATLETLAARHARHWSRAWIEKPRAMLRAVLDLLDDMRLVQRDEAGVAALPAAARYALRLEEPDAEESESGAGDGATPGGRTREPGMRRDAAGGRPPARDRSAPGEPGDDRQGALW